MFLGLAEMMFGLVYASFSFRECQALKMTLFAPCYSRLSLNRHLYKTDTSVKQTPSVGPFLSFLPLFASL